MKGPISSGIADVKVEKLIGRVDKLSLDQHDSEGLFRANKIIFTGYYLFLSLQLVMKMWIALLNEPKMLLILF